MVNIIKSSYSTVKNNPKGKYQLVVKASKWGDLKAKRLTRKTIPASVDECMRETKTADKRLDKIFQTGIHTAKAKTLR